MVAAPLLAFPDICPEAWRTPLVTLLTAAGLGWGTWLLGPWPTVRAGSALFSVGVVLSWALQVNHPLVSLRHFAGIGLGVWITGAVATWCTTPRRLIATMAWLVLGGFGVLVTGVVGTASSLNTIKFIRWNQMLTIETMKQLDTVTLALPGLEGAGKVNANALGGTAVMVLPLCLGLLAAARYTQYRRSLTLVALAPALLATLILGVTLSRSAWLAAVVCIAVVGVRWPHRRRLIAVLVGGAALVATAGVMEWRAASPGVFDRLLRESFEARLLTWRAALDQLGAAPWFGIGINQFHAAGPDGVYVAHAHNIGLQVLLDVGIVGAFGYGLVLVRALATADRVARMRDVCAPLAAGAGLSLLAAHTFGLMDAITLGAKVGAFQWAAVGLILAADRLDYLRQTR